MAEKNLSRILILIVWFFNIIFFVINSIEFFLDKISQFKL